MTDLTKIELKESFHRAVATKDEDATTKLIAQGADVSSYLPDPRSEEAVYGALRQQGTLGIEGAARQAAKIIIRVNP
jgi:hypothetical protein